MKRMLIAWLLAAVAMAVVAETTREMTPEEKKAKAKAALARHLGGWVIQPGTQKGHVALFNAQGRVGTEVMEEVVRRMHRLMHLAAKTYPQMRPVTPGGAAGLMEDVDAQAAVFLVDDAGLPALLAAPEQKWSIVNVAALAADGPDGGKLRRRVSRELWRGLAYACGAGASTTPHCLMNPCHSLADLDALEADMLSMEPFMAMRDAWPKMGLAPFRRVSYKAAVKEGWAPAPTNEWQKAIWEKGQGAASADPAGRWKRDFGGGAGEKK